MEQDPLDEWALLFTASKISRSSTGGIRFMMTVDDAKAWCSSDRSRGVLMGGEWAYFFYTVNDFLKAWPHPKGKVLDFSKCFDNGKYDGTIASMGLRKYNYAEIAEILAPLGVKVIMPSGLKPDKKK